MTKQIRLFYLIGMLLLIPFWGFAQVNLDSGLVAYYPFLDSAKDESGNGNNGIVHGVSPTTDRFGIDSSAYEFDEQDYIDLGDKPDFRFTTDFSVSMWIYYPGGSMSRLLLSKRNPNSPFNQFELGITEFVCCYTTKPSNFVSVFMRHDQNYNDKILESPNDTLVEGWHHIVLRNRINGIGYLHLDNILVDSSSFYTGTIQIQGQPLYLGASNLGNSYRGKIDDVRIYHRLLSLSEIDTLYNEDLTATSINRPSLTEIFLSPNPSRGQLNLNSPEVAIESIQLFDLTGRRISAAVSEGRHERVIQTDYHGLAIVKVKTSKGILTRKVVFE